LRKVPFSLEDKHTIKVLREQLCGARKILRMFWNKKLDVEWSWNCTE